MQSAPGAGGLPRKRLIAKRAGDAKLLEDGMIRFGFQIRTKSGQRIDNISIVAATQADAERRLRQMYHHCEIIDCREQAVPRRIDTLDVEGVIGLISAAAAVLPSVQKASTH